MMKSQEIEYRVRRIVEAVEAGENSEDMLVELKREWPADSYKVARQIAGHANAARGQSVLWIIGLDENEGVLCVGNVDYSKWWAQVEAHFDSGVSPEPSFINVGTDSGRVVAIRFDTSQVPYVVTVPNGGRVTKEVPWRRATGTRSARRRHLVDLLVPVARTPSLELLNGMVRLAWENRPIRRNWRLDVRTYVVPPKGEQIVLPWQKSRLSFDFGTGDLKEVESSGIELKGAQDLVRHTPGQAVATGPGRMQIIANFVEEQLEKNIPAPDQLKARISLEAAPSFLQPLQVDLHFEPAEVQGVGGTYRLKI